MSCTGSNAVYHAPSFCHGGSHGGLYWGFNYALEWPVSIMVFVMNAILLLISFEYWVRRFLEKTIVGVASLTALAGCLKAFNDAHHDGGAADGGTHMALSWRGAG